VDELIRHFIIENRLALTLLAMFFTPVGLYAAVRFLQRGESSESTDVERRLASMEQTIGVLVDEISRLREQQRLAAVERARIGTPRTNTPRTNTPLSEGVGAGSDTEGSGAVHRTT
jgi:hypothetical protein